MKKLLIFSAFVLMFTIFSCTPDEIDTQPKQETKKTVSPVKDTFADDGPGDGTGGNTPPPTPPPPTNE